MDAKENHTDAEMKPQDEELKTQENGDCGGEEEKSPSSKLQEATDALAEMKYYVKKSDEDGQTRFLQVGSDDKFEFKTQKHYDKLGDLLCDWIQAYMVDELKMKKVMVPFKEELKEGRAQAPIYVSEDWHENDQRALVLIQGTGDVRSGYWARSVCMNDTLELGSMIPDIEFARNNGFSGIVFNPNYSYTPDKVKVSPQIVGMNHHSNYCWKHFVENGACPAKEIFIVAHSAGGACAHEIIVKNEETVLQKVKAVALTDACHGRFYNEMGPGGKEWAKESGIAYDASKEPLDTPLESRYYKGIFPEVSAGHHKHVYTTGCSRPSYLKFFISRSETYSE